MEQTSLEELKRTAASGVYRRIPIWREIFSDIATPVQVLKKLLAAVMLAIIPIMCAYPFFQKYFTAGMTAGAVKG